MTTIKPLNILGLMSGTSLDGVKMSLVSTDGIDIQEVKLSQHTPYPDALRQKIRTILGKKATSDQDKPLIEAVDAEMTDFLIGIIEEVKSNFPEKIDAIGLEGATILHDPQNQYTYQLGKGRVIAQRTAINVISHFHNSDMLNGGQGSPITASYYNALAQHLEKPIAFVNIGGISNLTWIGPFGEIVAFDCGPGNALIDDWVLKRTGTQMDYGGKLAATGHVDEKIIVQMMKHDFFAKYPPKSLDRNAFHDKIEHLEGLSVADGAATATALVCESIAYSVAFYLPEVPSRVVICGGGAKNPTLVRALRQRFKQMDIKTALEDELDIEINDAQAIAYLAARRIYALPITFPTTTGVPAPMIGGKIYEKEANK